MLCSCKISALICKDLNKIGGEINLVYSWFEAESSIYVSDALYIYHPGLGARARGQQSFLEGSRSFYPSRNIEARENLSMTKITWETPLSILGNKQHKSTICHRDEHHIYGINPLCPLYLLAVIKVSYKVTLSVACLPSVTFCKGHLHMDQPSGKLSRFRLISFQNGCF